MDELRELFGSEALTYEQFNEKLSGVGTGKINLVNLAKGGYIDTNKHNREMEAARSVAVTSSKEYGDLLADRDSIKAKYEQLVADDLKKENESKVKAKIQPDFVEFVYDKVLKAQANDNKLTFEAALDKVVKESPQYKITEGKKPVVRIGSELKHGGDGGDGEVNVNSSMNSAILLAAGRTPKN